jgi:hypothetical protein
MFSKRLALIASLICFWYAVKDDKGRWRFAPSKFVGYEGIDAKTYLQAAEESDGRRTEAQLQMWFAAIDPMSELYEGGQPSAVRVSREIRQGAQYKNADQCP